MTLDAALRLASWEWHVFPLAPRSKVPAGGNGSKDATCDADAVLSLWSAVQAAQEGTPNLAVATGAESALWVLDVDGAEGERSLQLLEAVHGALPVTVAATTGRGRHLYFRWPVDREVRNSAGKVGEGLDVRGVGGYVVAPPSIHPDGRAYSWVVDPETAAVAQAPEWLLALVTARREAPPPSPYNPSARFMGATRYGRKALEAECAELARAPEGSRNDKLNGVAFRCGQLVASRHLDEDAARHEVLSAAKSCGLEDREAIRTWQSGFEGGLAKPSSSDPDPDAAPSRPSPARGAEPNEQPAAESTPQARPTPAADEPIIMSAGDVAAEAFMYLANAKARAGLPRFGLPLLDEAIGGQPPGTMLVIGGTTGSGKSSLGLEVALAQSMRQQIQVGWVSCEDAEWIVGGRLLASFDDVNPREFFAERPTRGAMEAAARGVQIAESCGLLCSFQVGKRIESVMAAVRALIKRGCTNIIVDYLQAIAARGEDRYHARTDHAQMLKGACHDSKVSLTLMSQLKRHDGEPSMNDLKDSGDIENMSEAVILLWKESDAEGADTLGKVSKVKWSPARPRFKLDRKHTGAVCGVSRREAPVSVGRGRGGMPERHWQE